MAHDEHKEDELDDTQEETPLCPNCLQPVSPRSYYCPDCGSTDAVNPLTTYMPWESLRFQYGGYGKLWRMLIGRRRPGWQVVLLSVVLLLAAPIAIPIFVVASIVYWRPDRRLFNWRALWTLLATLFVLMLAWAAYTYSEWLRW